MLMLDLSNKNNEEREEELEKIAREEPSERILQALKELLMLYRDVPLWKESHADIRRAPLSIRKSGLCCSSRPYLEPY
jgi:hypothetical protein